MLVLPAWLSRARSDHIERTEAVGSIATPLLEANEDTTANDMSNTKKREASTLLNIPLEIRFRIFSHLVFNKRISAKNKRPFRSSPNIFLVNRQLYTEVFSYTYHHNTAKIMVDKIKLDFLQIYRHNWYTNKWDMLRSPLPRNFPYWAMKEVVIEISLKDHCNDLESTPPSLQGRDYTIRKNLLELCAAIRDKNIRFKKLRITFPTRSKSADGWDTLWDSGNPDHMREDFWEHSISINSDEQRAAFRHPTCPSSFAYVLSVFALCPNIADECIIELPKSLKEKAAMIAEAKKYDMGLDGRAPLLEDYCLDDDRWDLEHEDGWPCFDEACKRCVQARKELAEREELGNRRTEAGERLIHAWSLRDGHIAPGVEFWENPLHGWVSPKIWASWSWENTRLWGMNMMVEKLGCGQGRKLYDLCFWGLRVFRPNYSKKEIKAWEELLERTNLGEKYNLEDWKHSYSARVNEMLEPGWKMRNPNSVSKYWNHPRS
ncbi:MAG: hypothetical protein Q9226_007729 [Calogaya cf. arnoldii]